MANGIDADCDLANHGEHLKQDGFTWVGRYIVPDRGEPLNQAEARRLSADGLSIVSLWVQGCPEAVSYFTAEAGTSAGCGAVSAVRGIGQTVGTAIYFAVEYDAPSSDLTQIGGYFAAVSDIVRAAGYKAGVYGSGRICRFLTEAGILSQTWLAASPVWAGFELWEPEASIVRGAATTLCGLNVNLDTRYTNAGDWRIRAN